MSVENKIVRNETIEEIDEALTGILNVLSKGTIGTVYGFHIDGFESDPYSKVTYLKDAVGKTPAKMDFTKGVFNYGGWYDAFFMPRPCMLKYDGTVDYYLDINDYSKKEDGTNSDIADTSYEGNAMMEWGRDGKKIWYKIVPDEYDVISCDVYIADYRVDEEYHAWSFINNQGNYVDHFYTPCYNGSNIDSVLRSMSGQQVINNQTAATERTRARNNNSILPIWDTEVYCDIILINLLLILIGKSTNTQAVFGEGLHTGGTEAINNGFRTGIHNNKGLFYGTNSGTISSEDYSNAVKIFGMENWWGFQWRRFGGLINDNGTAKYKLTRGKQDGSDSDDYIVSTVAADYSGYLTGGTLPTASGTYINQMTFDKNQFVPKAASGSASSHYCDGLWTNNSQVDYASRGGASNSGSRVGSFCLHLNYLASSSRWYFGSSPSCKPLD